MSKQLQKRAEDTPVTRERTHEVPTYIPAVDIVETVDAFTVVADMPGVDPAQIEIQFEENALTLYAPPVTAQEEPAPVYREFTPGAYERSFTVSQDIDAEKITAAYENGVLTLTLPKSASAQPRKIRVVSS